MADSADEKANAKPAGASWKTKVPDEDHTLGEPPGNQSMNTVLPRGTAPLRTQSIDPLQANLELEKMRTRLVELGIVDSREWDKAAKEIGPGAGLAAILRKIQSNNSGLDFRTSRPGQMLTDYQIDTILGGEPEKLRFDHYLILDRLGEGGMGTVLRALNLNLNRLEALKTVLTGLGQGTQDSSHARERFEREARVLASLDHPCITGIYHAGRVGTTSFIAMEFVRGKSLKDRVDAANAKGQSVPVWIACQYIMQIADALQHAHEHNVIHRDVKPNNVMISEAGELKVLDLGIARLFRPADAPSSASIKLTQNATGLGTPEVMSPEQWADATAVTPVADIYSLGCTFFYVLTGRMPFSADTVQGLMFCHVHEPPPRVSELMPKTVPKRIDDILARMLAKFPEERYQNCNDLIRDLAPLTNKESVESLLVAEKQMATPQMPWHYAAFAAALALVAVGAWLGPDLVARIRNRKSVEPEEKPPIVVTPPTPTPKEDAPPKERNLAPELALIDDWLGKFQQANAGVWPAVEQLKQVAGGAKNLAEAKKAVEAKTRDLRLAAVDATLLAIESATKECPPDLATMKKAAAETLGSTDVFFSDSRFAEAMKRLSTRFWSQKVDCLIDGTVRDQPKAWSTALDLRKAIGQRDISDEKSFRSLIEFVGAETKRRMLNTAEGYLAEHRRDNADVWPDEQEFRRLALTPEFTSGPLEPAQLAALRQQTETLTAQMRSPFSHLDNARLPSGEVAVKIAPLKVLLQWIAEGHEAAESDEVGFDARMVVDDKVVEQVKVKVATQLQFRCRKEGFITVLAFDQTNGQLQLFAFVAPKKSEDWIKLQAFGNPNPSRDQVVLIWTPKSLLEEANLKGLINLKPKALGKMETYSPEEQNELKSAFARPEAFERLLERLREGRFAKSFAPGAESILFAKKSLKFEVVE